MELWQSEPKPDPLVGARLLRKILTFETRWEASVANRSSEQEMLAMRSEDRRLAELAGGEDELWRVKVADLFWPMRRRSITKEEVAEGSQIGLAAASYFEAREDWEMFHASLDGYAAVMRMSGDHAEVIAAASRRLTAPTSNRLDWGDAVGMLVVGHTNSGDYRAAIDAMNQELARLHPGEPRAPFSNGVSTTLMTCTISGEWDHRDAFLNALRTIWEEIRRDAGAAFLLPGFFAELHVALAREDRASADAALSVVERLVEPESRRGWRLLLDAYKEDDADKLILDAEGLLWQGSGAGLGLSFLSERRAILPTQFLDELRTRTRKRNSPPILDTLNIHDALISNEPHRLKKAIDHAEARGLIPHAARMRIVLAEMSGDQGPLEQARPVLRGLKDRQFLRRLDEVAATLEP
jgi:hypothetical protein